MIDLVEGRTSEAARKSSQEHLQECEQCSASFGEWRSFLLSMKHHDLKGAPESLLKETLTIIPPRLTDTMRELVARPVFDSSSAAASPGLRGGDISRNMLLQADNIDIHLRVYRTSGSWQVMGQLLPRSTETYPGRSRLSLVRSGVEIDTTLTDYFGEFRFDNVPEGTLTITAKIPSRSCRVVAVVEIDGGEAAGGSGRRWTLAG